MKRILFVIPYLVEGGAERALSNITNHLPKDWNIDILVNDDSVIDYPFRGNILTLGITDKPRTGSVSFQFKVLIKRIKRLKQLKKTGNYQACISFLDSANIANILSGKRYCRIVVSVRISLIQSAQLPQYRYIVNPLAKLLYNRADKAVAVSKGVEMEMKEIFHIKSEKVTAIENGYNLVSIQQQGKEVLSDKENELLNDKVVIATTGRLSAQKGQWHLIRAFTEVIKQVPNVLLIIIGSGELEEYLKQLCQNYKMENHIYFTGHAANPYKYLSRADIFVFPSMYEGFPNALAEAVCLGLPCIATDFQTGAREILAPDMVGKDETVETVKEVEYGMLTPMCSGMQYADSSEPMEPAEKYLAEAMLELIRNTEKRDKYSRRSRERSKTLSIDAVINKWVEVVERC